MVLICVSLSLSLFSVTLQLVIIMRRCKTLKETAEDVAFQYIEKRDDPPWIHEKFVNETVGMFGCSLLLITLLCMYSATYI